MKKLFTLALAMLTVTATYAVRPIFVGHRGSQWGLENSVESFTNGAKMGYEYLETDFKVTKDKQLVCTHDDDLTRLGNNAMQIASSTLEELQAVPLTQTRLGVTYTGRLCSAQEYLDVCKEYNVRPLIELKWATGINSNDQSNIPLLIDLIEKNGFRDKCIILTSMKPCLEYIRKNYPDIELQFLTGQYWANHFDWCVEHGIDVDIQATYFDKSTVDKYHAADLKVNVWTVNDDANYLKYGNMGCDFITTDRMDLAKLPELDPSITFPANKVDYPDIEGGVKGSYNPEKVAEFELPAELTGRTVKKAVIDGDEWIVLSTDAEGAARIDRLSVLTGAVTGSYATTGIDKVGDIALTADGILVASNIAEVPFAGGGEVFNLYTWENETASPAVLWNYDKGDKLGNWNTSRVGEHIAVSGKLADLKLYISSQTATAVKVRIVGLWLQKNAEYKNVFAMDDAYNVNAWGTDYSFVVSPSSRDCIFIDSPKIVPTEYTFDWNTTRVPLTVRTQFAEGLIPAAADGLSFQRRAVKLYAMIPSCGEDRSAFTATLHDVSDGMDAATPVTAPLHEGLGATPATYTNTAISLIDNKVYLHIFAAGQGMASYALDTEKEVVTPETIELALECNWIHSISTNNKPENIDGTNAQQGTAVNGIFYVNNCAEKKLHMFDQTGYIGAVDGGAGWGCARDDAGNIVIRDDKETGTSHSFIVYPAGLTPTNVTTPVRFTVDVKLEGQTNFINAGGDLLGGTGHIYLYPNKQSSINIITVTKGVVTASVEKGENGLNFAGSTAGYVIPLNDDTENWIYQVRGTGLVFYNGGVNTALSTERASTTAPGRNSTTGGAYFTMKGNNIFVHNSGKNYVGGFTVRNHTTNEVIKNVDPIGNMGYTSGGNYSVSNWLIPEKVNDCKWTLYQYCPANGMACYTLYDKLSAVENIAVDNADNDTWTVYADHNTLTVSGIDVATLRVYNVAGVLVAQAQADTVDITALTPGVYIVTVNDSASKKFLKK